MSDNNGPADTLRDGKLKITIWFNENENAPPFSAVPARTYEDKSSKELRDADSFTVDDCLKMSELFRDAYIRGRELTREYHAAVRAEEQKSTGEPEPQQAKQSRAKFRPRSLSR